tara:strand:+ start:286 stop:429 length:144 start_codon:yes stop_codon:yes gene_type:complete
MTDLTDHEKLEAISRAFGKYSYEVIHGNELLLQIRRIMNDEPFDEDD